MFITKARNNNRDFTGVKESTWIYFVFARWPFWSAAPGLWAARAAAFWRLGEKTVYHQTWTHKKGREAARKKKKKKLYELLLIGNKFHQDIDVIIIIFLYLYFIFTAFVFHIFRHRRPFVCFFYLKERCAWRYIFMSLFFSWRELQKRCRERVILCIHTNDGYIIFKETTCFYPGRSSVAGGTDAIVYNGRITCWRKWITHGWRDTQTSPWSSFFFFLYILAICRCTQGALTSIYYQQRRIYKLALDWVQKNTQV